MSLALLAAPVVGVLALVWAFVQAGWIRRQDEGTPRMAEIAGYIAAGARAFLAREYRVLAIFGVAVAALLALVNVLNPDAGSHWLVAVAFLIGAIASALAGTLGMRVATAANVRTAAAARTSLSQALKVSFAGGSVMGLGVAGLAVLGLAVLFLVFKQYFVGSGPVGGPEMARALEVLTGFSLGAESIALFARVGGGIYTKAADVGADLVGKVEAGIPEDDPRNPATIADNVGDNVGDVAGMGADLFGSFVATILSTMVLGHKLQTPNDALGGLSPIVLPLVIAALGILCSFVGILAVRVREGGDVQAALNRGNWIAVLLTALASAGAVLALLPDGALGTIPTPDGVREFTRMGVLGAIGVGLVVGILVSYITEYYTAMGRRPVRSIIEQAGTGHATAVIGGLAVGMESTFLPVIVLALGISGAYLCAGVYGVAIAAAGMMATTAMQLAIDAFGPIADNAGGIAEMSELPKEVRERTDVLDAVGNTTAATGKGFAIASAALTSLALFAAFMGTAGVTVIDISNAYVLSGLFIGAMVPFVFSSLAIAAVGKAAVQMVEEVRRQFRELPGIMEGTTRPDYERCVDISTRAALREMLLPGALALVTPVVVGFVFGPEVLGGLLAGVTVSGVMMAIFQSNAGGAWDNAKKSFEKGVEINGVRHVKGGDVHKASVTGDTVGDPLKDTSGPSMNILIKLMSIAALVIAPFIARTPATHSGTATPVPGGAVEQADAPAPLSPANPDATVPPASADTTGR